MPRSTYASLIALVLLVACDTRPSAARPGAARARPAPSPPSAPVAPDAMPLAERLAREATQHPQARADVEQRLEAFRTIGVELTRTRQVLARLLGAQYCATALTAAGLALSVCAFESGERAREGERRSRASFDALIPGRTLLVAGTTLLTLTQPMDAAAQHEAERLGVRFMEGALPAHAAL